MVKVGKNVRKRVEENPFLPDELITNILVRLPVKSVVRFELVCRKWRDIILARDFVDLHNRRSIPVIILEGRFKAYLDLSAIDKWWDLSRTRTVIHRFPSFAADSPDACIKQLSHAGLIVLKSPTYPSFVIINPARPGHEFVRIYFSDFSFDICAVYYHPPLKEYCTLWKRHKSGPNQINLIEYELLVLCSEPYLRRIRNPFNYSVKDEFAYPLFINDHLYWMLESEQVEDKFGGRNDILEFDIISEEFKVIPCPVPLNAECKEHQTHLLNSDGVISFVLILPSRITIWRLEDRLQRLWTAIEYTTSLEIYQDVHAIGLIALVDGKLAFESGKRLFVCNLMEGTVKNYPKKYTSCLMFMSHQMTLASLNNCKGKLYIDKDGNMLV